MRYYGGKSRTGKEISEVIKKLAPPDTVKGYIEPFCGALGVMRHMTSDYKKCYASDACEDLILLWKSVQKGRFTLPKMTKEKWLQLKTSNVPSAERAFAGFGCSFGGKWFSAYAEDYGGKESHRRDPTKEAYRGILKIEPFIKNVKFKHYNYKNLEKRIKNGGYLIYCDPPYSNTQFTFGTKNFDFSTFWETIKKWKKMGNVVVVSEANAPRGVRCMWKKKLQKCVSISEKSSSYLDKLFIL